MKIFFDHFSSQSIGVHTLFFKAPQPFDYQAGQYVELTVPHANPDQRGSKRWFTLSSSPTEELLAITTRFDNTRPPISSFKRALFQLKPGQSIDMSGPFGDFVLPKDPKRSLVFIAYGIGITPIRSMIKWLIDKKQLRNVKLIYQASELEHFLFRDLFNEYGLDTTYVVGGSSHPSPKTRAPGNRISPPKTATLIQDLIKKNEGLEDRLYFISGPEHVAKLLYDQMIKLGANETQIVTDYFPGY